MPPLPGQAPADRAMLERFRDSLAAATDVPSLQSLESELIGRARRERDDPLLHLRLGFVALRLGQLTEGIPSRRHYDDAGGEFEWAIQVAPDWPWGWFGLGLAELGVGNSELALVEGIQTMLGRDALTRSANAFAKSAEVDPAFVEGLVELSNTALRQRINSRMDVALAALRRAGRTPASATPAVLLSRGRIERASGSLDSSAASLRGLLAQDSSNTMAWLELARTLFLQDDRTAMDFWYRGLAEADSITLALYREDLMTVLPDSTLRRFDRADPEGRVILLQAFWRARDVDELHPEGARLAEHYRRLDYARRSFRLVSERRQFDIAERYRSGQTEYDDRGIVYIRHGEPDQTARYNAPGIEPNETWLYRREGEDLLFHFVARQDVQDFRLVESLFDVLPFRSTVAMLDAEGLRDDARGDELARHTEGLLRSRQGMSTIYTRLLGVGRGGNAQMLTEEREMGRHAIAVGTGTDSWPIFLGDRIKATLDVLAVGSDVEGAQVQFAFAISGDGLSARQITQGFAYPVRTRASVLTLDGTVIASVDTTRTFLAAEPIGEDQLLLGRLPVTVPPGMFTVRMAVQTDDGGLVTARDTIRVASPLGPDAGLSDLALGVRSVELPWQIATGDTAWVNPTLRFPRDEPMQLYFEVTGMSPGTPYTIEMAVKKPAGRSIFKRLFGGSGTALRLSFSQQSPGGVDRIVRELNLGDISAGSYFLEVVVRTQDGYEISRQRPFEVVE
jgi:GWxTD domain-containing protein